MLKSTTDDRWLGLRPPQPDGRWWWWFIFDFVHNLTTAPHLRTPPACFLVWPNNILNKERQCWAWCGVKQRTEKLPDCSDARSRCQWSQDPHCTVQYSTVQNSTVQYSECATVYRGPQPLPRPASTLAALTTIHSPAAEMGTWWILCRLCTDAWTDDCSFVSSCGLHVTCI